MSMIETARLAAVALLLCGLGCQARASPAAQSIPGLTRPDGSKIIAYVDRHGIEGPQGLILFAQGSGCGSVQKNEHIEQAQQLILPNFAAVMVEDYGVESGDVDRSAQEKCGDDFYRHHTISQRVADYLETLAFLQRQPWWNGKLVLFGGSEGGAVVQELAPIAPAQAVIVYSSATGLRFRDALVQVLPPPIAAQFDAAFEDVRRYPTSPKIFGGNSYLWWADIMDRRLSDDLLRANEPILVIQGERDQSNPVGSARAVRDAFQASGKCNLTYLEFAGYDHQMKDQSGGDHLVDVMKKINDWTREILSVHSTKRCQTN